MTRKLCYSTALAAAGLLNVATRAQFTPVPLAPASFTQDVVVERSAPHAPSGFTTASMDEGSNNTAFGWYEMGYNQGAPDTGLPVAGSTVTSAAAPDHSYTFAASYTTNNALLVDTNLTSGTLTLTTPRALSAISLLTSSGHGPVTNSVIVHYANGSSETNSFVAADWFGSDAAVSANGRIDVGTLGFANVSSGNPNLYGVDVPLTGGAGSTVTSVEVRNGGTANGHTAVFGVSGQGSAGGEFTPLTVTGFNRDLVVEATAAQPLTALNATTASLDAGTGNTGFSFYERGYVTNATPTNAITSGLPPAGSTLTNASSPDHRYVLPASYTNNNALLVDASGGGTLTFSTPTAFSTLSFLTTSGNGAVTIGYTVNHADSSTETGTFVAPDWFGNPNAALITQGRVNVETGLLDNVGAQNPRVYSTDITLTNSTSPVRSIDLTVSEGTGHAVIFAVSGASGTVAPLIATQPAGVSVVQGSNVTFTASVSGSLPISYTWQVETNGTYVNLQNGAGVSGVNTATLTLNNVGFANGANYRLAVTNAAGSALSVPAALTVLSSATNILSASDTIEAVGGTSPAAESVEHAIDNDTQKYLNFGANTNQAAPFVGPAGFIVTPALGADAAGTVVTAMRIFTANDAPERDPSSYTLEGSNNGTNFTQIAAGSVTLPDARNAAGSPIDPLTQAMREVRFTNSTPYKSYRVLFPNVRSNATANSVQVAEVQLLGTAGTQGNGGGPSLTITRGTNGDLTITSSAPGTLQSTTALSDTGTVWSDEGAINGSRTVTTSGRMQFYRVVAQQ